MIRFESRSVLAVALALLTSTAAARAGDLVASVKHGDLRLVAKGDAVTFAIDQVGLSSSEFRLTPSASDTVNGATTAQVVGGVTRDVRFSAKRTLIDAEFVAVTIPRDLRVMVGKSGGGTVLASTFSIGRDVRVEAEGGLQLELYTGPVGRRITSKGGRRFDAVDLRGVHVAEDVDVELGNGDCFFQFIEGCEAGGTVSVKAGGGGTSMTPRAFYAKNSTVGRDLRFDLAGGEHDVQLEEITVGRDIELALGSGHDSGLLSDWTSGRDVRIALGGGDNELAVLGGQLERNLEVTGGSSSDQLVFTDVLGADRAHVALGASDDAVTFSAPFTAHVLTVATAGGDDTVMLAGVTVETDVRLLLASGDNVASLATSFIGGDLLVKAGDGNDTVSVAGDVTIVGDAEYHTGGGADSTP